MNPLACASVVAKSALVVCSWTSLATRRAALVTALSSVPSNRLICSCLRTCSGAGEAAVCAANTTGDAMTAIVIVATAIARSTAHLTPRLLCIVRRTNQLVGHPRDHLVRHTARVLEARHALTDGNEIEPPLRVDLPHQFGETSCHGTLLTRLALADDVTHALQQLRIAQVRRRRSLNRRSRRRGLLEIAETAIELLRLRLPIHLGDACLSIRGMIPSGPHGEPVGTVPHIEIGNRRTDGEHDDGRRGQAPRWGKREPTRSRWHGLRRVAPHPEP